jgi:Flp pilus assembly protein TadG
VEAIIGIIIIIPIGLAAVDLATIVSTSQSNQQIAEQAARAAACQRSQDGAQQAAEESLEQNQTSNIVTSVTIDTVNYDLPHGQVTVSTNMQVRVPVPLPWLNEVNLSADAMQPIVAFPASI